MEFVKRRCSQKIRKETSLALRQAGFCPPTAELGLALSYQARGHSQMKRQDQIRKIVSQWYAYAVTSSPPGHTLSLPRWGWSGGVAQVCDICNYDAETV